MPTAQKLINIAVGKLGAATPNTDVGTAESADALVVLNSMLDSWRIERLYVYQVVQNPYTWPANTLSRTIGPSGNFNVGRPDRIEDGFYTYNSIDYELEVIEDRERWDAIPNKAVTSTLPEYLFYDSGFPLGTLYLYPLLTSSLTVKLNTWQTLQAFNALADNLMLPPGYQRAIENNLAMELLPYYPNAMAAQLVSPIAKESKAAIKRLNAPVSILRMDPALVGGGRSNILTG